MAVVTVYSNDAIQNLAFAIVRQACDDYMVAVHSKKYGSTAFDRDLTECELFFRSNLFALICPHLEPEWIIAELTKMARNNNRYYRQQGWWGK